MAVWDAKQCKITVAGILMSGFGEGDKVIISEPTELSTRRKGVDGEVTLSIHHDDGADYTFNIKQTSKKPRVLFEAIRLAMQTTGAGIVPITVKNSLTGDYYASSQCLPGTFPGYSVGDEEKDEDYMFHAIDITRAPNGFGLALETALNFSL